MITRELARLHRFGHRFVLANLCFTLWGATYAAEPGELVSAPVVLVLLATLLTLNAPNLLNAAVDVDADRRTPGKQALATATLRLGRATVLGWAAAELLLAAGLAVLAAVWLGRPLIAVAVLGAVLLELAYNLEPVRLKRRGLANPLAQGLRFGVLPGVGVVAAVRPELPEWLWPLLFGRFFLLTARTLLWSVPDARADAAAGVRTAVVRHGPRWALRLTAACTTAALALLGAGLLDQVGPLWTLVVLLAYSAFLVTQLNLLRVLECAGQVDAKAVRHGLDRVLLADVLFTALPLLAAAAAPS